MTTLMLALPLSNPIRGPVKKRRVLLVDTSPSKRELRAETMRRLGMDVDCAADISEARSWWRADLYNLVLINMENEQGHRDKFCDDMRSATPPQQLAFLVGKPEYLADSPNTNGASSVQNDGGIPPQAEMRAAQSADISGGPPLRGRIRGRSAPAVVDSGAAAEEDVDPITILATRASPASHAGICSPPAWKSPDAAYWPARDQQGHREDCVCQEADRHLPSARKNKRVSRNNAIKPSAGTSGSRRKPKAAWTRCANCVSTPKHRQRFSASARMKPTLPSHPPRMKAGTSISRGDRGN